jgi:hypothetical protein
MRRIYSRPALVWASVLLVACSWIPDGAGQSAPGVAARPASGAKAGDPVDLGTGLYEQTFTDITILGALPITLKRTYRNRDSRSRPFGIGTNHLYDWFLVGDSQQFKWIEIVLEDGGTIHYNRISPGTGVHDGIFEHVSSPTPFYNSRLKWNGNGFDVKLVDGSVYSFGVCGSTDPRNCGIVGYRDPAGRKLRMIREPTTGNLKAVVDSNKAGIEFKYDARSRITQARVMGSNLAVNYEYDKQGRLRRVENAGIIEFSPPFAKPSDMPDPRIAWTEYGYDAAHNMTSMKNSTGFGLVNEYDSKNRPIRQWLNDGTKFAFAYTVNSTGKITQTDTTEPDGTTSRVTFTAIGNLLTSTERLGEVDEIRKSYQRRPVSDQIISVTVTCLSESGHRTSQTRTITAGESVDDIERELTEPCRRESELQRERASLTR